MSGNTNLTWFGMKSRHFFRKCRALIVLTLQYSCHHCNHNKCACHNNCNCSVGIIVNITIIAVGYYVVEAVVL